MTYPILDLSTSDVGVQVKGKADPKSLADQLTELRDALGPVLAGPQATVQASSRSRWMRTAGWRSSLAERPTPP